MKSMGAPEDKVSSQETTSEQARTRFSGKGIVLVVLLCAVAMALTALAVANNYGLSTIADNQNPMASGDVDDFDGPYEAEGGDVYYHEEPNVGEDRVAFYATEGGTLTYNPNDNLMWGEAIDIRNPDEIELFASYGVQTGLKQYLSSIAVTPYACGGSITAVADSGYCFTGWNHGKNTNPKVYIQGACGGYNMTAYFEKIPGYEEPKEDEPIKGEDIIFREEPLVGEDKVAFYATEGGTLTHNPYDDPFMKDDYAVDDPAPVKLSSSSGVQTGLKQYLSKIAVTPYAHGGSITAVPDPGYYFVGWNNGKNTNPKVYIEGACGGYNMTAYFAQNPVAVENKDNSKDSIVVAAPTMSVYAKNALDGNVTLAQGKSTSLNGFAVLADNNYSGSVTGKVKYESSNAAIATVDASGKVTASKKKTGTAKITVTSLDNPNCKKVVTVKVVKKTSYKAVKAITKLNLNKQYKANAKKQIAVMVTSWSPKSPSNKDYVVSVTPAAKASVDPATNKVTFKAKGTVKVTVASAENPKIKKTVTVKIK